MTDQQSQSRENWTDEQKWNFLVRHERLGEMLVRSGKLALGQLENALKEQENSGKHLGEILVEKNVLSREELIASLDTQKLVRNTSEELIHQLKDKDKD